MAGQGIETAYDIAVDSKGRYVVAGVNQDDGRHAMLTVWRYTQAGLLDNSFGTKISGSKLIKGYRAINGGVGGVRLLSKN